MSKLTDVEREALNNTCARLRETNLGTRIGNIEDFIDIDVLETDAETVSSAINELFEKWANPLLNVQVPAPGFFTLAGDEEGNLYCFCNDEEHPPIFEHDEDTGDLYLCIADEDGENAHKVLVGNYIAVKNLEAYYDKTEIDCKISVINDTIDSLDKLTVQKVDSLPSKGEEKIIYLVPNGGKTGNVHDEYIWTNGTWELFGTTEIDLSPYYTSAEIDNKLKEKASTSVASTTSNGLMSSEDKIKLNNIGEGANKTIVDSSLSDSSANPVQNKVINTALKGKSDTGHNHNTDYYTKTEVDSKVDGKAGTNIATTSTNGLMSSSDKTKLESIENGANKTIVDSSLSDSSVNPVQNKVVKSALDGKAASSHNHDDKYYTESEIDSKLNGKAGTNVASTTNNGLMSSGDKKKLDGITDSADAVEFSRSLTTGTKIGTIKINGTSTDLYSTNNTTYSTASSSSDGLMSKSDKSKLDKISDEANKTTVDSALSTSSTNPVQNKVVKSALDGKAASSHTHKTITNKSVGNFQVDYNQELGIAIVTWWTHAINVSTANSWVTLASLGVKNVGKVVYTNSVKNSADGTVYFRVNNNSGDLQYNSSSTGNNIPIQPGQLIYFI